MDITLTQVIYALTFIFVILAVEGVYLFLMSRNSRERAVNRRMKLVQETETRTLDPSILKRHAEGGIASKIVLQALPSLSDMLWAADLRISPAGFLGFCGAIFAICFLIFSSALGLGVQVGVILASMFGLVGPLFYLISKKSERQRLFAEQLPSAIDLVTRGLQAGHPVPVALEMVSREMPDPIGTEFGLAIDQINYGLDRVTAMRAITRHFPNQDFRFFVAALEMQRETGGNLVDVLNKLSEVIRARSNMRKKVMAISAEGRLTAFVVGGLPFAIAAVINLLNPNYYAEVLGHPSFAMQMGIAFFLWAVGIFMIWKMVNFKI